MTTPALQDNTHPLPYTEAWLPGPSSHQFYTRTYLSSTPPRAILLFIHGFAEHIGRYDAVFPSFALRNIGLFAFDQRGFGRTALDAAHRSPGAAFGRTSWKAQMEDIEFWVRWVTEKHPGVPVFLMGHSMGGGLACAFATRGTNGPPSQDTVKLLSGVILSSPFLQLTHPKPRIILMAGGQLARLFPTMSIPASVNPDHLSRNTARNEAYMKDPLIKQVGTLRGTDDMISGGEKLVKTDWQNWPQGLPALFMHGTADQVTSHEATEKFYNDIPAHDKRIKLIPGAYHEMFQEIDGIPEKLVEEIASWVEAHVQPGKDVSAVVTMTPEAKL